MIDLDAIWTPADDLYCQLGVLLCLDKITYQQWQSMCRVLCHYRYVFPEDRFLNAALMDTLFARHRRSAKHLMLFVMLGGHLEAHYNEAEQARLLTLLISKS